MCLSPLTNRFNKIFTKIAERVGVSHGSAVNIVNELGLQRFVPDGFQGNFWIFTSKPVLKLVRSLLSVTEVTKLFSAV